MINNSIKLAAFGLMGLMATNSNAQVCHNLYPYAEGVTSDNNGHDLRGFIKSNKKDVAYKADKITDFSKGKWGYVQIDNARVPSINIHPVSKAKKVDLSYTEYINATLALYNTTDGVKATWWARQCNNQNGPMFYKKTEDQSKLDADNVKFDELKRAMELKDFTIVEYNDSTYNDRDYDQLLKNYLIIENLAVKDFNDYKTIIDFYNNFLTKFTYVDDPLLDNTSFITCFSSGSVKYIGYFNIIDGKLGGHLETVNIQYEKDKDALVNIITKKLNGKRIYVYGDDIFNLEKALLKYGHNHPDVHMIRRKTDTKDSFNKQIK